MKLFITGANGSIGSELCKLSHSKNIYNKVFIRRNSQCNHNYYQEKVVLNDISDVNENEFKNIDVLVHLAAVGVDQSKYYEPKDVFNFNVFKSTELILKAINSGIKKFIIIGSCTEYGKTADMLKENISVMDTLLPTSIYSASKAAFSSSCIGLAYSYGVSIYILRPFNVYGETEASSRLYTSLINKAECGEDFHITQGDQIKDFSSYSETAQRIFDEILIINESKDRTIKIKNLGSGNQISVYEFAKKVWLEKSAKGKIIKGALPYRKNEPMKCIPDLKLIFEDIV
ncbi:NAD-dependent epimerase/dehydratase family protein [Prochlorococcus sp. MIT 1223]|uniref:NAD-dependent epimerase/dehydratase family protein n=1 Tax=Prochlorococcus sp. MIT 1223 TaxID=3096217 RepID=UPI002A757C66|nr:NAD-dependent epimerase/dehydratase family protein [Prochlorococcus sp. MIT 1223]